MEDPAQDKHSRIIVKKHEELPPSPPQTEENGSESSDEVDIPMPPSTTIPTETLDIDKKTPDAHVPRDPRLIRLTGVHPFNVEAPLSALFNEGFLTSPELFYVRNHGAVPKVKDEDIPEWEFSVEGYVIPCTRCWRPLTNIAVSGSSKNHSLLPSASSSPSTNKLRAPSHSSAQGIGGRSRIKSGKAKGFHGDQLAYRRHSSQALLCQS